MRIPFVTAITLGIVFLSGPYASAADDRRVPEELANRVIRVVDLVMDHHVDPPTRDALLHAFCLALEVREKRSIGIGRVLSSADEDQLRSFLADRIEQVPVANREVLVSSALQRALMEKAATKIVKRDEQRVQKQIEANRYVGIGIAIGMSSGLPSMMRIFEDGPADRGGAKSGDLIQEVDGTATRDRPLAEVVSMLRGPSGSDVEIVVTQPGKESRTLQLTRDVVPFKQVEEFKVIEPGIASVKLRAVTGSIVSDLRRLSPKLKQNEIDTIVLQIMSPQAGYRPALLFANAMIDGGRIGGIERVSGIEPIEAEPEQLWPGTKIAVLVGSPPNDALAWALHAMERRRHVVVLSQMTAARPTQPQHMWVYEEIDLRGTEASGNKTINEDVATGKPTADELVAVLPTGRFLSVRSDKSRDQYTDLRFDRFPSDAINTKEAAMPRNNVWDVRSGARLDPVARAIAILKFQDGEKRAAETDEAE